MHALIERLQAAGPVLTDGAWGTQLQLRGLRPGEFPDSWNLLHPDRVLEVAKAYVKAGSQIILTNTFGANRLRLAEGGLADKTSAINTEGVAISRAAAATRALVFASIGPSGRLLSNEPEILEAARAAFSEQAMALAKAGADALVIETMTDLDEARLSLAGARATGLPVVVSMVFDSGKNKDRTMMGISPEQAARELTEAGADVLGANCGQGIDGFASICARLRAASHLPIWLKPNAGLPKWINGKAEYSVLADDFAQKALDLAKAGGSFIGGCCGTSPDFIRAIHDRMNLLVVGGPSRNQQ